MGYNPGGRGYLGRGNGSGRTNDPKKPEKLNDPMSTGPGFWLFNIVAILIILAITLGPILALRYFNII